MSMAMGTFPPFDHNDNDNDIASRFGCIGSRRRQQHELAALGRGTSVQPRLQAGDTQRHRWTIRYRQADRQASRSRGRRMRRGILSHGNVFVLRVSHKASLRGHLVEELVVAVQLNVSQGATLAAEERSLASFELGVQPLEAGVAALEELRGGFRKHLVCSAVEHAHVLSCLLRYSSGSSTCHLEMTE